MIATLQADRAAPADGDAVREVPAALRRWRPRSPLQSWGWALLVTAIAALTRFWAIGFPSEKIFDEIYYATEAQEMLRYGYEDNRDYMFIVHPPLGKWAIGLTSWVFGDNSVGWRVAPAIAGTLSVLILIRVGQRMFRSTVLGVLAGALLTMDGISLVVSRTALLDVFLQVFILAGFAALVIDRDQLRGRLGDLYAAGVDMTLGPPRLGPRPWRLVGGVLLGLAFGVKWSALSFWGLFALLCLVWDRNAFKSAGVRRPLRATLKRSLPTAVLSLGVAPAIAYLVSWTGWFVGEYSWNRHWGDTHPGNGLFALLPSSLRSLLDYHHQAYLFHTHLYDSHPYKANPWSWLILGRPISFYSPSNVTGCGAASCTREILLIGTPIMYWAIIPMLIWTIWHWATTRDWRCGVVLVAFLAGWAVWLHDIKRTMFLFYMAPLMPYLMLGLAFAVGMLLSPAGEDRQPYGRRILARVRAGGAAPAARAVGVREWVAVKGISAHRLVRTALVALWLGAVVADFIWMWPIFTGGLLSTDDWRARMWFPSWI